MASFAPMFASADNQAVQTSDSGGQCVDVSVERFADRLNVEVDVLGAIRVAVWSNAPGEGLAIVLSIVPGPCAGPAQALTNGAVASPAVTHHGLLP